MIKGNISSIETLGLVDGPGIRTIIFMQGCPLRCIYCHNPETWEVIGGKSFGPVELIDKIKKYKSYYKASNGGITLSGGEPLLQSKFLLIFLKLCKDNNINVALDTCGVGSNDYKKILKYVDLVIFDIKHINNEGYTKITGKNIKPSLEFLNYCQKNNKKMWLRQVIMPNFNDNKKDMDELIAFIKPLKNIEKVELLPYKSMCKIKYKDLGINYILDNMEDMNEEKTKELSDYLNEKINA